LYRVWIIGCREPGVVRGISPSPWCQDQRQSSLSAVCACSTSAFGAEKRYPRTPPERGDCGLQRAYQSGPLTLPARCSAAGRRQASLLVQSPRRVFPFLWQATPLQARRKSLTAGAGPPAGQRRCSLRSRRRVLATRQPRPEDSSRTLSNAVSTIAPKRRLGLPIRLSSSPDASRDGHPQGGSAVQDTIAGVAHIDARGVGGWMTLIRLPVIRPVSLSLVWLSWRGRRIRSPWIVLLMPWPTGLLEPSRRSRRPGKQPSLSCAWAGYTVHRHTFIWDGVRFVSLLPTVSIRDDFRRQGRADRASDR